MAPSTQSGWILAAARSDQKATVWLGVIGLLLSGAFLGWNGDVLYNAWQGPFDFTADLAASPGRRQWVTSSGAMVPTGLEQQSTLKLFKGAVSTTNVTAKYLAQPKLGKLLIVKVSNDFSGDPVIGELVPLPAAVLAELGTIGPKERFHPYLLDATQSYFTVFSLYGLVLLFAALVFFLSVVLLGYGLAHLSPEKHEELAALARLGSPSSVAARIESDIARAGSAGVSGPFRHSPSWLVVAEPLLRIVRAEDLVAFAPSAETTVNGKQKTASFAIHLFRKGQESPVKVDIPAADFVAALAGLRSRFPWAYEEKQAAIAARWTAGREACERDTATRRAEVQRVANPAPTSPAKA